jgi:hypothetical protein
MATGAVDVVDGALAENPAAAGSTATDALIKITNIVLTKRILALCSAWTFLTPATCRP